MAIDTGNLRREIEETRLIIEDKYAIATVAARKLAESYEELLIAEENRELKNGSREIARHEIAEESFKLSLKEYFRFADIYNSTVDKVSSLYETLIESDCAKGAKKARAEAKRFMERESYRKDKLSDTVEKISGVDEAYDDYLSEKNGEISAEDYAVYPETKKEPVRQTEEFNAAGPYTDYNAQGSDSHTAAAVNIDITHVIESAVATAMDRFNAVLESRMNKTVEGRTDASATESVSADESEDILKMHSELVGFELEIAAKLAVLTEKLKSISEDLINIGASCIELSNIQREAAESQKKTEEMQRAVLDDARRTEESQRLISETQAVLLTEQQALIDMQRSNTEKQAFLTKEQAEISDLQKETYREHKQIKKKVRK